MSETLLRRRTGQLSDDDREQVQLFRLAGLLHDIGHYPFSHAMQEAVENACAAKGVVAYKHENVGAKVLEYDDCIRNALGQRGIDPRKVTALFERTNPTQRLANLISSDLDADRLDYLLRTSHFTGIPYGSVDIDYLISQLCQDNEGRACLIPKAIRAADAFLISRLMDYQQVAYHRAVAAYEWLLKDVIEALLLLPDCDLDLSRDGTEAMIASGAWASLTDTNMIGRVTSALELGKFSPVVAQKASALLYRHTPALVGEIEGFVPLLEPNKPDPHTIALRNIEAELDKWANAFGVDPKLWKVWEQRVTLTKMGSRIPTSVAFKDPQPEGKDRYDQMIRLCKPDEESLALAEIPQSLASVLSNYNMQIIRVYVLLSGEHPEQRAAKRSAIRDKIRAELSHLGWTGP